VAAVMMVNIGKLVQDLLLWSTREFGYLRLADAFVQSSSIMPQKRNPVALEHVRILASRALGEAQAVLTCAHNTPFGDVNDSEDDLQPLVFSMFADARRALRLLAGALTTAQVDTAVMADRARRNFLTVTELADTLVRREGLSFREAHALVAEAVRVCGSRDDPASLAEALRKTRPALKISRQEIERCLDPEYFVQIRSVTGGPAREQVSSALDRAAAEQRAIETWIASTEASLDAARAAVTAK
jgi:argininosuccinate lyase